MRLGWSGLLLAALIALTAASVRAADPVGTWELDARSWDAGIGEVVRAAQAAEPDPARDPEIGASIEDMLESEALQGEVELLADGHLRSRWNRRGKVERNEGTWVLIGQEIELAFSVGEDVGGDEVRLRGPLEDRRMRLKPVLAADKRQALEASPVLAAAMRELTYPFLKR
jgi:hypothetical protein